MRKWPLMHDFLRLMAGAPSCWIYPAPRDQDGYAFYCDGPAPKRAHQAAFAIAKPTLEAGQVIRHSCDNPPCCRPDHLSAGTQRDNCADAIARDRQSRGERNGRAKLTADQVRAIRADERTQIAIAASYGIRQTTVSEIKRGNRWRHI